MLDADAPETPTTDDVADENQAAAAQPPRRRRSASRPAGPPAEIPAAVPPRELIAAPEPAAIERTEPAFVEAEVIEIADAAPPPPAPAEKPARTPRKRASRPAGPPVERAEPTAPEEVAPEPVADLASATKEAADTAAASVPAEDVAASLAALEAARRRRTTRRAGQAPEGALGATDVAGALDNLAAALASRRGSADEVPEGPVAEEVLPGEATGEPAAEADEEVPEELPQEAGTPEEPATDATERSEEPEQSEETEATEEPEESEATEETESDEALARRRRRRRGGRRRRRVGDRTEGEAEEAEEAEGAAEDEEALPAEAEGAAEQVGESASRRRRRRRRRGEDGGEEAVEDGVDVVVRVREPRRSRSGGEPGRGEAADQITGIEGSTRLEAKRQRRREGRAAGRRRAPILSEAEFLARRESVDRKMVIRQRDDYTQIGVLEDGILVEHYVDRDSSASMIGNIYLGRVQNVLPSMEAAFVDIGRGRNAVLYAGEVDWDSFGAAGTDRKVEKVLKSGQAVLVQVTKDPVGAKGARLTSHISIPGRYVVYSPGGQLSGISRKLPENERARLKGILDALVGENASVIVRTAAEGASEDELVRDVSRLKAQWEVIEKKVAQGNSPQLLYSEPDLTVRIVRDLFTEDFSQLVVDSDGQGADAYETVQAYVTHVAPHLQERLVQWNRWTDGDLFEHYRIDEQVAKALERKVHLPSGGSLVIDRTEAMTVIDVNTGKFTGTQGNLEATVTSNNLEAAEEIVRQLRLRDIGGIIVIDFIDMVLPANRELLLRRLVECLGRDRTRHQVAEVTSLGLVQMTRKRIGTGLLEAFTVPCETCKGRGYHIHAAPVGSQAPADGGERDQNHRRGRNSPRSQGQGQPASE
nr:Rne/Rng family ribonuclease [Propionibacterium sp.]